MGALGSAIAASVAGAVILARTQFNSDIFEGWVMLVAAFFTASMIWFMNKTARSMKGEIEAKLAKATSETLENWVVPAGVPAGAA